MYNRSLILRYGIVFIGIIFILYAINSFKWSKMDDYLQDDIKNVTTQYQKSLHTTYKIIDIIFDSYIQNNTKLLQIIASNKTLTRQKHSINKLFQSQFQSFKQYSIEEINFYSKEAVLILNSKYPTFEWPQKNVLVNRVVNSYKTFKGFEFSKNSVNMTYIKPLFNKKYELIGAVEFRLNMQHLTYSINKDSLYNMKFIFDKTNLFNELELNRKQDFVNFGIDRSYVYKDSVYVRFEKMQNIYNEAFNQNRVFINKKMNDNLFFASTFKYDEDYYSIVFIPIFSTLDNTKIGYLLSYHNNFELNKALHNYSINIFILALILFVVSVLSYIIHVLSIKNTVATQAYHGLKNDIDKYVIMTETNKDGIIQYVTQAFCIVSGYTKQDLIGRPQSIVRHPDMSKETFKNMWKQLHAGKSWEGEIKNIDKNGNSYWIKGIIVPIIDHEKNIIGYRSIRVNITDEKQLSKVNSILKDDLSLQFNEIKVKDKFKMDESKIELMGKILDAFANEWKKPLSHLSLISLDLQTRVDHENVSPTYLQNFCSDVNESLKSLSTNLNEFKYIFHNKNINEKYNVYDEVQNAIVAMGNLNDVYIKLSGDENLYSFGIANDFNKIITSIFNNALEQFELKNIKQGTLHVNIIQDNDDILVHCQDNAHGIPLEIMPKIFQPDFTTKVNMTSKGLSLYISKLMLQKNGGDLSVKNVANGSCFTLRLISKDRRKKKEV